MELMIGAAVAVAGGVTWLLIAAKKKRQTRCKQRRSALARQNLTSGLARTRSTVHDQMARTSDTYLKDVKDTIRR